MKGFQILSCYPATFDFICYPIGKKIVSSYPEGALAPVISAELVNPGGDPTAYRIRGTVIALRSSQARLIKVAPFEDEKTA